MTAEGCILHGGFAIGSAGFVVERLDDAAGREVIVAMLVRWMWYRVWVSDVTRQECFTRLHASITLTRAGCLCSFDTTVQREEDSATVLYFAGSLTVVLRCTVYLLDS